MQYETFFYNKRWWVRCEKRLLGGYSGNDLRSYVFPLYTPQGVLVLQEAPPDHPHHQGICAGLEIDGHDLWNAGSFGKARHRQVAAPEATDLSPVISESGVTFTHSVDWWSEEGKRLLRERRSVTLKALSHMTMVDWISEFSSPNGGAELGQTKEAGIGMRVPPHWETRLGGQIRNASGQVGEAECFDRNSAWINVQGAASGTQKAGIILMPGPRSKAYPWFTRDYGLHLYNPSRHHPIILNDSEKVTWSVRVFAYDGDLSIDQINTQVPNLPSAMV